MITEKTKETTNKYNFINIAKEVFNIEQETLQLVIDTLGNEFNCAIDLILNSTGRLIVTGMGKSGHIGAKIAATLASTGTTAYFVHPAEMGHGDLGMVRSEDIVLAISFSGNTDELRKVLMPMKKLGAKMIALTGNKRSTLSEFAEVTLETPITKEACPLNLAPTSSTTAALVLGDALAVALMKARDFQTQDFAKSHPLGSLGQSIVKISEIMRDNTLVPRVLENADFFEVLNEITNLKLGFTTVSDSNNKLIGIITDGDLRRAQLDHKKAIYSLKASAIMTANPQTLSAEDSVYDAIKIMKSKRIADIVITNENEAVGVLDLKDILAAGYIIN